MRISTVIMLLALCLAARAQAAEPEAHGAAAHAGGEVTGAEPALALSPPLRAALVAEMGALRQRVGELAARLATGEWELAVQAALQVRDSYIMQQGLSDAEREALVRALPPRFAELDAGFHRDAERLAHAAQARDGELALFYYGKLLSACQGCHARYATHTLPGFRGEAPAPAHHH